MGTIQARGVEVDDRWLLRNIGKWELKVRNWDESGGQSVLVGAHVLTFNPGSCRGVRIGECQ
jgi:hypothetical protein